VFPSAASVRCVQNRWSLKRARRKSFLAVMFYRRRKTEKELTEEGERGIGSDNVELLLLSSSRCTIYCEGILMLLESACSAISSVSTLGAYSSSHEIRGIFTYQYVCILTQR
jgi:hypothetical protein